jgi:hypothetical protein
MGQGRGSGKEGLAIDLDDIIRRLDRVLIIQEKREARENQIRPHSRRIVLTKRETQAWLEEQPTFSKPIVKPISDDSYRSPKSDGDLTEPLQRFC